MSKENESKPKKECRAIRLARKHVQFHEIIGSDGLQDRMVTFDYYAKYGTDTEEFSEAANRFVREARRILITPAMTKKDEGDE